MIERFIVSLPFIAQFAIVFVVMGFLDAVFALYTRRAAGGRWMQAGLFAGLIALSGSITVISYSTNNLLVIPLILGAMTGTMVTVWYDSRDRNNEAAP